MVLLITLREIDKPGKREDTRKTISNQKLNKKSEHQEKKNEKIQNATPKKAARQLVTVSVPTVRSLLARTADTK